MASTRPCLSEARSLAPLQKCKRPDNLTLNRDRFVRPLYKWLPLHNPLITTHHSALDNKPL